MEDLYCGFCKSVPKFPIILPCCLKTICKEHKSTQCVFCSSDLSNTPIQPNNILLHYFNSKISGNCDRCEDLPSTISCHNCKASLCKECSLFLHSKGIYTKHVLSNCSQLINNVDNLEICTTHKLPLKFFCEKDWQALCRRCKESHSAHGPLNIEVAVADILSEINTKDESLGKYLKETEKEINKCTQALEGVCGTYDNCKSMIISRFKSLKQVLQWKEEELLGEVEVIFSRKKMEIDYFLDCLTKNAKMLKESIEFIDVAKKLQPSIVLSQLKYINHIIDQALEIENVQVNFNKSEFPGKLETGALQSAIESLCLIDGTLSINTSISNTNNLPSSLSSMIKSPPLVIKSNHDKPITPIKSRSNSRDSSSLITNLEDNPLETRVFKKKLQSSTAIQVSWNHPMRSFQGLIYCLEYGVGTKLNNIEQFRQVYKGTAHTCIITDLLPKTSYRFRVSPQIGESKGDWSEIITVTTHDTQKIDVNSFGAHANIVTRAQEKYIQFDKPGVIFGTNSLSFGKYCWEVKILSNSLYAADGNLIRIGVSGIKSKVVYGSDIEYQSGRGAVKVRVIVDIESGTIVVVNSNNPQNEVTLNLPEGPIIPAIQYKPSKNSTAPLRMAVDFDV